MSGNRVLHANNRSIRTRLSTRGLRTIAKIGYEAAVLKRGRGVRA
jgi:ribosomal protein L28